MIISDISTSISSFSQASTTHIFREINTVVDKLAKHGLSVTEDQDDLPDNVVVLIRKDVVGRTVSRH